MMKKIIPAFFIIALFYILPLCASADTETAENIVSDCDVSAPGEDFSAICNGVLSELYTLEAGNRITVTLPEDTPAQGIYFKWDTAPVRYSVSCKMGDGSEKNVEHDTRGIIQDYCGIPEGTRSFSVSSTEPLLLLEMEVYSGGMLPDSVHLWTPTAQTCELMTVSAHQDDEVLFFGGILPYYAGEKKLDTVVVYVTYDSGLRLHEALEGLWVCGVRQHPVFLRYEDKLTYELDVALERWGEENVVKSLADCIVKYKPQVIVSHDFDGEYGHGQHKAAAYCLVKAIESAAGGVNGEIWNTPKCYIHLYAENEITIEWNDVKLESMGGISALDAARLAYEKHESQHVFEYEVIESGYGDCRRFGLYRSTVGQDTGTDLFEHITPRILNRDIPEKSVVDNMTAGAFEYVYSQKTLFGERYLRYGEINGVEGWYPCDEAGGVFTPAGTVIPMADKPLPDGYEISERLSRTNADLFVVYAVEQGGARKYVRYGTADGKTGWFETDRTGEPKMPLTVVDVPEADSFGEAIIRNPILIGTAVAAAAGICVFVMIKGRKKRR